MLEKIVLIVNILGLAIANPRRCNLRNKLSWILISGLVLCVVLLVVGWFGIPYYVGQQVKSAVAKAGFAPGAEVKPSYWLQKVSITHITITPSNSPIIKKVYIPELTLDYNAASLLYGKARTITIPTVEIQVIQPITEFIITPGASHQLNQNNIATFVKLLPKQKLTIKSLIIKNQNAGNAKIDNIFKVKLSLKPRILRKGHYKVNLTLDGANPKILMKDTTINGALIHATMTGNLVLTKEVAFSGNFNLRAGTLTLPNANLLFEQALIKGNIHVKNDKFLLKGIYQADHFHILNIAFIEDPIKLNGHFTIKPEEVHVDLDGSDEDGYLRGHGFINNDVLSLNATSIDFVTQRINLQSIFAWLTQPIVFTQGVININGTIGLSSSTSTSLHVIGTNLVGSVSSATQFSGLNTDMEIIKFKPFTSGPNQKLTIAEFNLGLPLKNVNLSYQILPDVNNKTQFQITHSQAQFAGGSLTSDGFLYNPNDANHSALLNAHNISVDAILKYTKVKGLSGTGRLNGTLLFQWGVDGLQIKEGHLQGTGEDNKIMYIPAQKAASMKAQSPQLALAMNALKNFHYKNFMVTINSQGKETHLVAKLTGFNPDLYDGLPVDLNFTLTGELNLILDTILIGDQLKRKILDVSATPG